MIATRAAAGLRHVPWAVLPVTWAGALGALVWLLPDGADVLPGLAVTPALALATGARRRRVLAGGLLAVAVIGGELVDSAQLDAGPLLGAAVSLVAVICAGMWTAARRSVLSAELDRTREIALAAQQVLLRPLPRRAGTWSVAGAYLSASRGAHVGGDFYEVLATPFGVRALIGDARGHGLPAIGMVAALLGSFREAAHQEGDLAGVLLRLDGTLRRHLRERVHDEHPATAGDTPRDPVAEEFATVQLVQLGDDGIFRAVNCGHPQPYLLGSGTRPLPLGDPLPPLGLFDADRVSVPVTCGRIAVGEGLLLHTDGLPDARDPSGRFFPLPDALHAGGAAGPLSGRDLAAGLSAAVQRHTDGRLTDDMALIVLIRDAGRPSGHPRPALLSGAPDR
ncbi:PP2C family protein-serine/threonine phosphatase [Actinacidiphila acididurans]|uniref:Serine/threonine-protein phosphatase n=1 Tax=Actinacidiphila acididurans TaxID=2784346 RepID=A0ABS2U599_9ACTN|nr:PP2C family protein-serine/threonine phosphatase [Actinacidiphila acididurans]MBM9510537.1 serine/threonine-protein phosphatase [Actinacidiphila acididurans]